MSQDEVMGNQGGQGKLVRIEGGGWNYTPNAVSLKALLSKRTVFPSDQISTLVANVIEDVDVIEKKPPLPPAVAARRKEKAKKRRDARLNSLWNNKISGQGIHLEVLIQKLNPILNDAMVRAIMDDLDRANIINGWGLDTKTNTIIYMVGEGWGVSNDTGKIKSDLGRLRTKSRGTATYFHPGWPILINAQRLAKALHTYGNKKDFDIPTIIQTSAKNAFKNAVKGLMNFNLDDAKASAIKAGESLAIRLGNKAVEKQNMRTILGV